MRNDDDILHLFSEYLFWDVRKDSIDLDSNESYIIKRVLEFGQMSDWRHQVGRWCGNTAKRIQPNMPQNNIDAMSA